MPCMMLLLQEFPHGRRNISTHFGKFVHCLGTARVLRLLLLLLVCLLAHFLLGVCIGAGATAVVLEAVGVVSLLLRLLQLRGWQRKLTTQRRARTDARTKNMYIHTCMRTCTHTHRRARACRRRHRNRHTDMHTQAHIHAVAHAHRQTVALTHTQTHRHIDTQKQHCQPQCHKNTQNFNHKITDRKKRAGKQEALDAGMSEEGGPKSMLVHVLVEKVRAFANDGLESVRINPVPCASSLCPPPCDPRQDSSYRHERAKPSGLHPSHPVDDTYKQQIANLITILHRFACTGVPATARVHGNAQKGMCKRCILSEEYVSRGLYPSRGEGLRLRALQIVGDGHEAQHPQRREDDGLEFSHRVRSHEH